MIDADALLEGHTGQVVNHRADEPDARSRFYGYGVNVETTSTGQILEGDTIVKIPVLQKYAFRIMLYLPSTDRKSVV